MAIWSYFSWRHRWRQIALMGSVFLAKLLVAIEWWNPIDFRLKQKTVLSLKAVRFVKYLFHIYSKALDKSKLQFVCSNLV